MQAEQVRAPNSAGVGSPKLAAPANACDCHIHIYDSRFPVPANAVPATPHASVADYRLLQKRIGTTRVVVVQPRNYATDNRVTIDALTQLGANARGIAVVSTAVTDTELKQFHAAGVRGIRFSLTDPSSWVVTPEMIEPLARRIADFGWHVQFGMDGAMIEEMAPVLKRLPTTIVIDHLGRPPLPAGVDHPSHGILLDLLNTGRAWVKLSCAYINSKVGAPYPEATRIAQSFVRAAPERLVWGTDWPHPVVPNLPDDALLFDLMSDWVPNADMRRRILVENPEQLYGFV